MLEPFIDPPKSRTGERSPILTSGDGPIDWGHRCPPDVVARVPNAGYTLTPQRRGRKPCERRLAIPVG
jgi:hypothetical protein